MGTATDSVSKLLCVLVMLSPVLVIAFVVGSLAYLTIKEMSQPHLKRRKKPKCGFEVRMLTDETKTGGK